MNKIKKEFLLSEFKSIKADCENKEKKYKTNIDVLKRICFLYNEEFKGELDINYINVILSDILLLQAYLIQFFCKNINKLKMLYNIINKGRVKYLSYDYFSDDEYEAIINGCKLKPHKINISIIDLLRIAHQYNKYFPNEIDMVELEKKDKFDKLSYLSIFFCTNIKKITKLYTIVNSIEDIKSEVEEVKKGPKVEKKVQIDQDVLPDVKPNKKAVINQDVPVDVKPDKKGEKKADKKADKKLVVVIKPIDEPYKDGLKKIFNESGINEYSVEKFDNDIKTDSFIKMAIKSNIKSLQLKLQNYKKLLEITSNSDTIAIINRIIQNINENIKALNTNTDIIQIKRKQLLSILNDTNNGILSIKGKLRENIRNILIRLIYIYITVPDIFYNSYNNFILLGQHGTGRTKLANVICHIMHNLGLLLTSNFITEKSINKSHELFINSLEGVLYLSDLNNLKDTDEIFIEFINNIERFKGCILIIISGNKDKITTTLNNKFNERIELVDYDPNDIYIIFENLIDKIIYYENWFNEEQRTFIKNLIIALATKKVFKDQANDIFNLVNLIIEHAILYGDFYDNKLILLTFKLFLMNKGNIAFEIQ